jgi:putative ABC transport system substrate-binding protein
MSAFANWPTSCCGSNPMSWSRRFPALAVKDATRTVPVVAVGVDNPVQMGLAASLARPGGNFTGISGFALELIAKRLQLVHQLVPTARRIGILVNPNVMRAGALDRPIVDWEHTLGVRISVYPAVGPDEFEGVFNAMARDGVGGLVVLADANTYTHRVRLNALCLQWRMPSVWGGRDFLTGGGLASYQSDFPAMYRRAAALVDKVLKGGKPAEIAFEQSTKIELVIDRRAINALGIAVPRSIIVSADAVLE